MNYLSTNVLKGFQEIMSLDSEIKSIEMHEGNSNMQDDQNKVELILDENNSVFINKYELIIRTQIWALNHGYVLTYDLDLFNPLTFSFIVSEDSELSFVSSYSEALVSLVSAIEYICGEVYE